MADIGSIFKHKGAFVHKQLSQLFFVKNQITIIYIFTKTIIEMKFYILLLFISYV